MKYKIELTAEQMRVVMIALEEYFRLRLGQTFDFASDIAGIGIDLSPDNPKHDRLFDEYLRSRGWIENIMKGIYHTIWSPYGVPQEKTEDMMIAECIWDAIRFALGKSIWYDTYQIGSEPSPKIKRVGDVE